MDLALKDLDKAITVAEIIYKAANTPRNPSNNNSNSTINHQGNTVEVPRALVQALVQRGVLYRGRDDNDKAYEDFEKAAAFGNNFAKQQVRYLLLCYLDQHLYVYLLVLFVLGIGISDSLSFVCHDVYMVSTVHYRFIINMYLPL